jgi:DNA-binding MarR family transcriptional regulator
MPARRGTPESAAILERLIEVGVVLTASMDAGLAERGLTRARAEVLWHLQQQPKRTQRELSQLLRCTPRNVTDLVDTLEASGLVAREQHPTDRRATIVTLTRRGKSEVTRMQAGSRALAGMLFAGFSSTDLSSFMAVLDLVLSRLGAELTQAEHALARG